MYKRQDFYNRSALDVAQDLLGKILVREVDGKILKGKIVETEAYIGSICLLYTSAGPIADGVQPLLDVLKDLAEPFSYAFMVKGFLSMMAGNEHEGKKTIKYAIGGYVGIQFIPQIFDLLKGLKIF